MLNYPSILQKVAVDAVPSRFLLHPLLPIDCKVFLNINGPE